MKLHPQSPGYSLTRISIITPPFTSSLFWEALLQKWFLPFIVPERIISGNATIFHSRYAEDMTSRLKRSWTHNAPGFPQARAPVEIINRHLNNFFRTPEELPRTWPFQLRLLAQQYNLTHHESLGFSPAALLFGRQTPPTDWNYCGLAKGQ
ncbi:hypothetical protein GNI_090080 [Gregarina niphandrodes]|uniref:Integrase catalytic domain-containing protein n=1 Tax=Gregarina niphandrodes TaxID=110365 RepID=A0A023B5H9_GRENI|nr:hypothetical protein GNI_090080 [Gregarina niphandrodes]EZG60601.1 hypothetical protein GNI_090080 [Gregarina niphandrodes]|eukprot:XP_011130822.1 hypothetical protein GNI_090080 [Gregarina niphandrodes]